MKSISPDNVLLSDAAELLGDIDGDRRIAAVALLLQLTQHESPLVREGAVYGLAKQPQPYRLHGAIFVRLGEMAEGDTSQGVREAAREALLPT